VFTNHKDNSTVILAMFVDDEIASINTNKISILLHELENLEQEFEINKGNLNFFLGIEIHDGSLFMRQTNYAKKVIQKFNL